MFTLARVLFATFLLALSLRADSSLENARRAQALLDPAGWSQVLRIENTARLSRYPKIVHALVFEFAGILWFYTDLDGTQSFSLHQDALAEEKADLAPLLRDIDRGFVRWSVVPAEAPPVRPGPSPLRNGCFVESVAGLLQRRMLGLPASAARLLSYYAEVEGQRYGHTVLAYEIDGKIEVFDPNRRTARLTFPASLGRDALTLAQALTPTRVFKARYVAVPEAPGPASVASHRRGEGTMSARRFEPAGTE